MLGIDVSEYQKKVDWTKAKAAGVTFVHIKATEGLTFVDPTLAINQGGAARASVPYGFYHFARPDHHPGISGAKAEAKFFCDTIKKFPFSLRPTLDLEEGAGDLTVWAGTFLTEVERITGCRPLLYSYTAFLKARVNPKVLVGYPLWVADYGRNDGADHGTSLPNVEHQFTSRGAVNGVLGSVDENHAPSLYPLLAHPAPKPKPKPLWPIPLPSWFWTWAQWRRDGQSYQRPWNAPKVIPPWAWIRLKAL